MEQKRRSEIIRILLKEEDYITINQLAGQLQVSGKTVRNDLTDIAGWLAANDLTLVKKTGVGIFIEGSKEAKLRALNLAAGRAGQTAAYSPEARKIYIALRLITCQDNCRIYELANELYVSRATIHKDITSLTALLEQYHITLTRKNNNGVQLSGKERSLRDMMLHLMQEDNGYTDFIQIVQNPDYACRDAFIYGALDYTDRDIYRFVRLLLDAGSPFLNALPFRTLLSTLLRIYICLIRMLDGHPVTLSDAFTEELAKKPLYPEAAFITGLLASSYHIAIPEMETRYLQVHFLSLRNQEDILTEEQAEAEEIADIILADWERALQCPFTKDRALHAALAAHLEPAITRLRHGIPIENPLMYEIENYYKNTFLVTKESVQFMEERYGCPVSNDEIGYLAIYLASALEHRKRPLNTVLVSHGGQGAGQLLLQKLSTQIPEIRITSIESFLSVKQADLTDTDIILSTLQLPSFTEIPVIQITPLLHDSEIIRLKEILSTYYKKKNDPLRNVE